MKIRALGVSIALYWGCLVSPVIAQCTCELICVEPGPPVWTYSYTTLGSGSLEGFILTEAFGISDAAAPPGFMYRMRPDGIEFYAYADMPCGGIKDGFTVTAKSSIDGEVVSTCHKASGIICGPIEAPAYTATPSPAVSPTPLIEIPHSGNMCKWLFIVLLGWLIWVQIRAIYRNFFMQT